MVFIVMLCGLWEKGFKVKGLLMKNLMFSVLEEWNGFIMVVVGFGSRVMLDLLMEVKLWIEELLNVRFFLVVFIVNLDVGMEKWCLVLGMLVK